MMITLPFANLTKVVGIEDGLSYLTIFSLMIVLIINFSFSKKSKLYSNFLTYIFLILLIVTLFNLIQLNILIVDGLSNIFKIIVFIFLIDFLIRNELTLSHFLSNYYKVYLISLVISIPIYYTFPYEEFVFFDGSANRFGGLHFELYNFLFSTILFFLSWTYSKKNLIIGFLITFILILQAKSNVFIPYVLLFLFIVLFKNILKSKSISFIVVFSIILSPILIGVLLEELEILNQFSVRSISSFDHQGSSLYIRLYPYSLAIEYIYESGIKSLLPMGLGFFQNTDLIVNDPFSYGGTGSPKALVDVGIIIFGILIIIISNKFFMNFLKVKSSSKFLFLSLFLSSLLFISLGSGFFNLIGWFILIASLNYPNFHSKIIFK